MELFIIPMSCSFAAHLACLEAGLTPTLRHVARSTKRLDDGSDYAAIVPMTLVPAIREPDGFVLGESAAVLQYIADQTPESGLAPRLGSRERHELAAWLNFVATEVHKKAVWMIFSSKTTPEMKAWARAHAAPALDHLAGHLADRAYLMGDRFTVADCYLFWALLVAPHGGLALDGHPALGAYVDRIQKRPAAQRVLAQELPLFQTERARDRDAVVTRTAS